MEKKLFGSHSFWNRLRGYCAIGLGLLFMLSLSSTAFAQNLPVTGTVTSTGGALFRVLRYAYRGAITARSRTRAESIGSRRPATQY